MSQARKVLVEAGSLSVAGGDVEGSGSTVSTFKPTGAIESLTTAAPAASLTSYLSILDAGANAVAATLANGSQAGHVKKFKCIDVSNAVTVTLTGNPTATDVITFTVVGDEAEVMWTGTQWNLISTDSVLGTNATPTIA